MNFNNNQISIIEKLVDDRIYFLKENIFYCRQDIENYCTKKSELEANQKTINEANNELTKLVELKVHILKNTEVISK
tara:strand:- start:957 stop:1187 length:231 start_codon:yes stop_codon:yes gene_type:complete